MKTISFPLDNFDEFYQLKAGEFIRLNGKIYTARDQAHKRLIELIENKKNLPINLENNIIYYCGPTPPRKDNRFGSAGPTTSSRMDPYTLPLLKLGLKGFIGKGERANYIKDYCKEFKVIYFITFGGAGAYLANQISSQKLIAFEDLGTEAIYEINIIDFPVVVAIDTNGNSIF